MNEKWRTFSDPDFQVRFKYPEITPEGHTTEIREDRRENIARVHFISTDSQELYFEVARYLDLSWRTGYEQFKEVITRQFDGLEMNELVESTVASQPAFTFSFRWPAVTGLTERTALFIPRGNVLYRVIYNPRSPLNLQVLSTLEFGEAS
ncbi:MAG: hypothetical protein L0332_32175 [Chloroflexi bacterium]|nr:hypothetical protein [Chloroflexota bacterium]MCI0577245.1 hypothetical protein [Chloroflexota bacterium]MCI0646726.1 hypothetical protein [Chloroflexota bacterium]MCI0731360.1 hypothetical protein [Chloroflexota bacterium]